MKASRDASGVDPNPSQVRGRSGVKAEADPPMGTTTFRVVFAGHVAAASIDPMLSYLQACGNVQSGASGRSFAVEVHRRSNLSRVRVQLTTWQCYGFLRWAEGSRVST